MQLVCCRRLANLVMSLKRISIRGCVIFNKSFSMARGLGIRQSWNGILDNPAISSQGDFLVVGAGPEPAVPGAGDRLAGTRWCINPARSSSDHVVPAGPRHFTYIGENHGPRQKIELVDRSTPVRDTV